MMINSENKKEKYIPGKYEKLLAEILRERLSKDDFIGTLLMLIVNQESHEDNCKELYEFLKKNPNASHDDVMEKADEIVGIYIDDYDYIGDGEDE